MPPPTLNSSLYQLTVVIILTEHWLWPYEMFKLDNLLEGFTSFGRSDKRLTEHSTISCGCGGIAILWKNHLQTTPVTSITSNRIAAIYSDFLRPFPLYEFICPPQTIQSLSILIIFWSLSLLLQHSRQRAQSSLQVTSMHTWVTWHHNDPPNHAGNLLSDMVHRCDLFIASLSKSAVGADYTYANLMAHAVLL